MPITDRLMQTGSWSLELLPHAPDNVRKAMAIYGSQVYFTPAEIPDDDVDLTTLREAAFYAGMVTRRQKRSLRFGGPNLLGFLVSSKGGPGIPGAGITPALPYTFTQVIQTWVDGLTKSNGLTYGTAYSPTATTVNDAVDFTQDPPLKAALDTVAKTTGNEYVCRPTGLIDYGVATSLFNASPNVLIAPGLGGREGTLKALEVDDSSWDPAGDIDSFRNYGYVVQNNRVTHSTAVQNLTEYVRFAIFNDPTTSVAYYSDPIFSNSDNATDTGNMAQAAANEFANEHLTLPAQVREYCLHRFAIPGDYVWVHDPDSDIVDRSNPQTFQGDTIFPKTMRLMGFTSPIEAGMGVRVVSGEVLASGPAEIVNVTNYVRWERGRTSLELDSLPYRLGDVGSRTALR